MILVDEGQVLTSAGAAAGFDLCLHLVRRDHGAAVAAEAARTAVMPLEREGGQGVLGTTPQAYRRAFRGAPRAGAPAGVTAR